MIVTALQVFSLVFLLFAFAAAIYRHVNIGLMTIPAAFILAEVAGVTPKELYTGFQVDLVLLVIGVMYLFGHAERSGALARIVRGAEKLAGPRTALLPWLGFLLAALISGMGALPGATVAIVMPITMQCARKRGLKPMLMGLITIFGALAGGFSPISVFGQLLRKLTPEGGYQIPSAMLFLIEFGLYTAIAVVSFFLFGGHRLLRTGTATTAGAPREPELIHAGGGTPGQPPTGTPDAAPRPSAGPGGGAAEPPAAGHSMAYERSSLAAIGVFAAGVLAFGLDVGLTAFTLGLVLHLIFKVDDKRVIAALPWGVALNLAGILAYVGILIKLGTFNEIANGVQHIPSAALSALLLAYFAALFSSFESSSVTVLAVSIPIVLKVEVGLPDSVLFLVIAVVAFCSAVISISPYHVNGALLVTNGGIDDPATEQKLFRGLLGWSVVAALVLPPLTWLIPLVPLLNA